MTTKVNILIDGGFLAQKFKEREHRFPKASEIKAVVDTIMQKLQEKTGEESKDILFRVYYYDCNPFGGKVKKPGDEVETDYSLTPSYKFRKQVIEDFHKQKGLLSDLESCHLMVGKKRKGLIRIQVKKPQSLFLI